MTASRTRFFLVAFLCFSSMYFMMSCTLPQECTLHEDCNDEDPCTNDYCSIDDVCVFTYNTDPCDDLDACTQEDTCFDGVCSGAPLDADGDTYVSDVCGGDDCDDSDPDVFQDAPELCDGIDNQCVGDIGYSVIDEDCPYVVFVTEGEYNGNLGGVAGADDICQAEAEAAGLPHSFRAWLATTPNNGPAIDWIASDCPGYVRPDGIYIADCLDDFFDGEAPFQPINVLPDGRSANEVPGVWEVWTNIRSGGIGLPHPDSACLMWTYDDYSVTAVVGDLRHPAGPDFTWTDMFGITGSSLLPCSYTSRLYCFQQ